MFYQPLLYALLTQVALTFLVWVYLYYTRMGKIFRDNINPQDLGDRSAAQLILVEVAGPSDNFNNLFETPVLFYVAIAVSLAALTE